MKFRNYCIVVMGTMDGVKDDILKVAESKPRYIDGTGVLMVTFASVVTPSELKDFITSEGRSFFIFDLNDENSAYHMDNLGYHSHLFDHLTEDVEKLNEMSEKLMEDISATTKNSVTVSDKELDQIKEVLNTSFSKKGREPKSRRKQLTHITDMSKKEREGVVNKILDKGYEKLTKSDKDILKKISKLR